MAWVDLAVVASVTALAVAAFVQSATGFGFAVVAVPLLMILSDPVSAVVIATLSDFFITALIGVQARREVQWRLFAALTLASLLGIPIGLVVLTLASPLMLTVSGAAAAVLAVAVMIVQPRFVQTRGGVVAAGGLSGVLLTATGINGPPLVAAVHGRDSSPRTTRATLAILFAVSSCLAFLGFTLTGQLNEPRLTIVLLGIPGVLLGGLLGEVVIRTIDPRRYRIAVIILLALAAAGALARSVSEALA